MAKVSEIAQANQTLVVGCGHAGDGNIHPIILFDKTDPTQRAAMLVAEQEVTAAAVALGGTITGEHGVGSDKLRDMAQRWAVVRLLDEGKHYAEISRTTGASTATITRIASWLHHGEGGYQAALARAKAGAPPA